MAWSLLIVDDHAGFRAGARALLQVDGFEVLGEAPDGESALEAARRLRPRVVLLDIQLPEWTASRSPSDWPGEPTRRWSS